MGRCMERGCENPPIRVVQFYITMNHRRVRLWACAYHFILKHGRTFRDHGVVEVDPPEYVMAAEREERERMEREDWVHRVTPIDRDVRSVRELAPSGHGERIAHDRVANWRWGDTNVVRANR